MSDERVLERIAKLLELAERGDEHEAKVAAARAAELMARHQIEMADVVGRSGPAKIVVEHGRIDAEDGAPTCVEGWNRELGQAVSIVLGARCWIKTHSGKRAEICMVGPVDTVRTARYMYLHLARQVGRLSREAGRTYGETSNAWRRTYASGMVLRIYERMLEARRTVMATASTTAMVHVDATKVAVDAAIDALDLRKIRSIAPKRPDARGFGYRDGRDVDLGAEGSPRLGEGQKKLT